MRSQIVQVLATCALLVLATNCGGNSDDSTQLGSVGETVSLSVTAATGATVALPSAAASVTIPGLALAADTTITITAEDEAQAPEAASLGSHVFSFGPDGTAFLKPVTLALKLGAAVPAGKKAELVWLDGAKWSPIAGSAVAGDVVRGEISHFSRYAIRFGDSVVSEGAVCENLAFTACGGDPTGSWTVEDYCIQARPVGPASGFADVPACTQDGNMGAIEDVIYSGTLVLAADQTATQNFGITSKSTIFFTDACLAGILAKYSPGSTSTMAEACAGLATNLNLTCAYATGRCECDGGERTSPAQVTTGTWSVSGTQLSTTKDGSSAPADVQAFCVDGARLVIEFVDSEDTNGDGQDDVTYLDHLVLKKP